MSYVTPCCQRPSLPPAVTPGHTRHCDGCGRYIDPESVVRSGLFAIFSEGVAKTPGMNYVIDSANANRMRTFDTRAHARAYADEIKPSMPSKDLPLVVREVGACA